MVIGFTDGNITVVRANGRTAEYSAIESFSAATLRMLLAQGGVTITAPTTTGITL